MLWTRGAYYCGEGRRPLTAGGGGACCSPLQRSATLCRSRMPTPAEILERNAQQAKQAQAGGGKAHEGGGLLADADFEVSDDLPPESEMMKDASAFWMEKFSLKLCGKNLSAENTRKLLIAG